MKLSRMYTLAVLAELGDGTARALLNFRQDVYSVKGVLYLEAEILQPARRVGCELIHVVQERAKGTVSYR